MAATSVSPADLRLNPHTTRMTAVREVKNSGASTLSAASPSAAWMCPYHAELLQRAGFTNLSPVHQFRALLELIAIDHPARAATLGASTAATAQAILAWLAEATGQRPAVRADALWQVRKGMRELQCVAIHLPTGIDLRLIEGDDFRRTAWCPDRPSLLAGADDWLRKLIERGWMRVTPAEPSQDV
jgi:hypothetical protein